MKSTNNCNTLSSFKGTTQAYLLSMPITHYKKRIPLLELPNNCISTKSVPQILFIKSKCTFCFSYFLIIGFYNSIAHSLFGAVLIALAKADFSVVDLSDLLIYLL